MPKDDKVYVSHMRDSAAKAVAMLGAASREEFDQDETLLLALAHLIQMIGEAARQVSREYQDRHPGIEWTKIIGMRNKVVHDYLALDPDIVWNVVSRELEPLIRSLDTLTD